ncbi:hypothetical protein DH09_10225 [Bacillaceae bacterium JMAK1]|nr:hypothetical protein DH09_10225 [Bacillaceae bacterium JMAK1]
MPFIKKENRSIHYRNLIILFFALLAFSFFAYATLPTGQNWMVSILFALVVMIFASFTPFGTKTKKSEQ